MKDINDYYYWVIEIHESDVCTGTDQLIYIFSPFKPKVLVTLYV